MHLSDAKTHHKGPFQSMATRLQFVGMMPWPLIQGCWAWLHWTLQNEAKWRQVVSKGQNDSRCTFPMPKLTIKGHSSAWHRDYSSYVWCHGLWSRVVRHDCVEHCKMKQNDDKWWVLVKMTQNAPFWCQNSPKWAIPVHGTATTICMEGAMAFDAIT